MNPHKRLRLSLDLNCPSALLQRLLCSYATIWMIVSLPQWEQWVIGSVGRFGVVRGVCEALKGDSARVTSIPPWRTTSPLHKQVSAFALMKPEQADRSQSRLFPCVPPCRTLPAAAAVFFLVSTRNQIKGCHTSAVSFHTMNLSRLFFQIKLSDQSDHCVW